MYDYFDVRTITSGPKSHGKDKYQHRNEIHKQRCALSTYKGSDTLEFLLSIQYCSYVLIGTYYGKNWFILLIIDCNVHIYSPAGNPLNGDTVERLPFVINVYNVATDAFLCILRAYPSILMVLESETCKNEEKIEKIW
uniref:Uncharacterized protein n=1 Tax=Romanomermis culicivorax TaxID=13658 RepID=A0A915KFX5_ROMCU